MTGELAFWDLAPTAATSDPGAASAANEATLAALAGVVTAPVTLARLAAHERARSYPRDVLAELRSAGLASLFAESHATAYHLAGLNALCASASGSLAITVGVNALALLPLCIAGSDAQRAFVHGRMRDGAALSLLLTEWAHGSDLARNEARAVAEGSAFRVIGDKHLINGGGEHDLLVCLLRTREREGVADFTLFLVERGPHVRATRRHRTLPCAAADISDVAFDGTLVPADAAIGGLGEGFSLVQRTLSISRGGIGALASGAASAARRLATAHATTRELYGRPILQLGAIGEHLAHLCALDAAAAALAIKQALFVNALGPGGSYVTAVAKVACTSLAERAVDEGRRVLGARALIDSGEGYERLVRDVLLYGVFDGTTHVMLEELQWRLAQLANAGERPWSLADLSAIYAARPRTLREAVRTRGRVVVPPVAAHLRELARVAGDTSLAHVAEVAPVLLAAVAELRRREAWDGDQPLRFAAAGALTQLEAIAALAELCVPACRDALALGPLRCTDAARYHATAPFAVAWLGAQAAGAVRAVAARTSVPLARLDDAERELHLAAARALAPLVGSITTPPHQESHR